MVSGATLTGNYCYNDAENDLQGTSTYKWYRADDASGLNETAISGATSTNYTVTVGDQSKYLRFAVTPIAQTGASPGSEVKATVFLSPAFCGTTPFTVNHVTSGGVAPENKTTSYSAISGIPGEPEKCWITKNLGASQQATAVDDATEASAGWYWQFNRKQGYRHDGATLTPAWSSALIIENSDWLTVNDPCSIELGAAWRIATYTEWNNIFTAGGWNSGSSPWNSALKLHFAGIIYPEGFLGGRGSDGNYWTSNEYSLYAASALGYYVGGSGMNLSNTKTHGFSIRCMRGGACSGTLANPVAGTNTTTTNTITWNWNTVSGATGYKWNTVNDYTTSTDMNTATTKTETGLACNTTYTRFIWAYNGCGSSVSTILTQGTFLPAPASGANSATSGQIIWAWHSVNGATGYKWNTVNDYSTAVDMGTALTKTETGMTCNTSYTRYVWAYNTCGNSIVAILSQSTQITPSGCGQGLTFTHTQGAVAPVTKTTVYYTTNNIPGEPAKCWITSNLGSDRQATDYHDSTEPSRGWYWQFNRKQGYKHDGTTRTPSTTWITSIEENSDWLASNEPCKLLLGSPWRLPTSAEYFNVSYAGGWGYASGSWNSGLKIHYASCLVEQTGNLMDLGGYYWAGTQASIYQGGFLKASIPGTAGYPGIIFYKAAGFTIRCLKDN